MVLWTKTKGNISPNNAPFQVLYSI